MHPPALSIVLKAYKAVPALPLSLSTCPTKGSHALGRVCSIPHNALLNSFMFFIVFFPPPVFFIIILFATFADVNRFSFNSCIYAFLSMPC